LPEEYGVYRLTRKNDITSAIISTTLTRNAS
jgi:hypothetical protein